MPYPMRPPMQSPMQMMRSAGAPMAQPSVMNAPAGMGGGDPGRQPMPRMTGLGWQPQANMQQAGPMQQPSGQSFRGPYDWMMARMAANQQPQQQQGLLANQGGILNGGGRRYGPT